MSKTPEELNALKVETLNKKFEELTEEELEQVAGGGGTTNQGEIWLCKYCSEWTFQTWIGVDAGWDSDGNKHMCDLWLCEKCNCTNYRDINTGRLI